MPLTMAGSARYNIANIAGAALLAALAGVEADAIASVLAEFGSRRQDNPGRLERWNIAGASVFLDYAHNPEGLAGLLEVASRVRQAGGGRMGLLLGQAGNREDAAVIELARAAAAAKPDLVVLKDLEGYLRGRTPGEVPLLLHAELRRQGLPETALRTVLPEVEAAKEIVAWSRPGDVLVLPVHNLAARAALVDWLDRAMRTSRHRLDLDCARPAPRLLQEPHAPGVDVIHGADDLHSVPRAERLRLRRFEQLPAWSSARSPRPPR